MILSPFDRGSPKQIQNGYFAQKRLSFCFGTPRESIKNVQNINNLPPDPIVPGPGTYTDTTMLIGVQARKSTIKARNFYMDPSELAIKRGVPGPGHYED